MIGEIVRFAFNGTLYRVTDDTGFEHLEDGTWVVTDVTKAFGPHYDATLALHTLITTAAKLDGMIKDLGTQVFLAAIRTQGMKDLGFSDAVLN